MEVVDVVEQEEEEREDRRGRRHLDGSDPGKGQYLPVVSVTLRPGDAEDLEVIGDGNRSAGVRVLLDTYRQQTNMNEADAAG